MNFYIRRVPVTGLYQLLSNAAKKINVECSAEMHAMPVVTLQDDGVSEKGSTHG